MFSFFFLLNIFLFASFNNAWVFTDSEGGGEWEGGEKKKISKLLFFSNHKSGQRARDTVFFFSGENCCSKITVFCMVDKGKLGDLCF